MDANNSISTTEENGAGCENEVNKHLPTSEEYALKEKDSTASVNDGLTASSGNAVSLKDVERVDLSLSELVEVLPAKEQNDSVYSSKEHGVIEQAGLKDDKPHKVAVESKNQKLSSLKTATTTGLKKGKDGKDVTRPAASNGTHSKEASGLLKSKPSNDKKTAVLNHHKPVPAAANGPKQQPGLVQPKSPSATAPRNEILTEKTKPKLVKKNGSSKSEGTAQSSSPTSSEDKTRNVGALPAYGFSFKCDERAEKRREFYSKLEEKIQAKEAEKSNLQAKSQETREAELKRLRKSLMFKATPMPSFYQEPAPPKTELKKIPPTRAKSPKLGRKKISSTGASEEEINARANQSRSLDEKLSDNIILSAKEGSLINNVKKPLRTSLPKLPSQKTTTTTNSLNEPKRPSVRKTSISIENATSQSDELNGTATDVQEHENEATVNPSETQIDDKIEPLAESRAETSSVNELIPVEH